MPTTLERYPDRFAGPIRGAYVDVIDAPMVFVLWPAYGARSTGFHFAASHAGLTEALHTHPAADECVVLWYGQARCFTDGRWWDPDTYDCVMAPCGVKHGFSGVDEAALWGGFASPPQLDMYTAMDCYDNGAFEPPPFERLTQGEEIAGR